MSGISNPLPEKDEAIGRRFGLGPDETSKRIPMEVRLSRHSQPKDSSGQPPHVNLDSYSGLDQAGRSEDYRNSHLN